MKKHFLITLLLLCFALPAHAGLLQAIVGASGGSAVACSSGTADVSFTDGTDVSTAFTTDARGQTWVPATNGAKLYSITVYIAVDSGTATGTLRWGLNPDLRGTCSTSNTCTEAGTDCCLGEKTTSMTGGMTAYEFVFQDSVTSLSTGTTYYLGLTSSSSATMQRKNTGGYAGGNLWYAAAGRGFEMNNQTASYDINFIIKKCD